MVVDASSFAVSINFAPPWATASHVLCHDPRVIGSEDPQAEQRRERWWRSTFIIVATIYVSLLLLGLLLQVLGDFRQIFLILFIAWLLAFILAPIASYLQERLHAPRGLAIGGAYAAALIGIGFVLFYAASSISTSLQQFMEIYPEVRPQVVSTLEDAEDVISFGRFQPDLTQIFEEVEDAVVGAAASAIGQAPQVTASILGSFVLVIILSLYMLADSAGILARLHRVVPSRYAREEEIFERTISRSFGGFLRLQVLLAAVQALLTAAVVFIFGLPFGFLIVATSTLAMLIPFFGPPLALIPPILGTLVFATPWTLLVAPVLLIVQTILVNYIQPRLMRDALGMHPITVIVALLVGATIAGLWGAIFVLPVIAVLNVFFNYAVNLRTLEESTESPEEVIEEVRHDSPDAPREELVALAAERVEEEEAAEVTATEPASET
jgi:predicted PurR-regulated permease PerM